MCLAVVRLYFARGRDGDEGVVGSQLGSTAFGVSRWWRVDLGIADGYDAIVKGGGCFGPFGRGAGGGGLEVWKDRGEGRVVIAYMDISKLSLILHFSWES